MNKVDLNKLSLYQDTEKKVLSNDVLIAALAKIYESSLLGDFEPQSWHQFDLFWDYKEYKYFPKEKRYTIGLLSQAVSAAFVFKTDSYHVFEDLNINLHSRLNALKENKESKAVEVFNNLMSASNVPDFDKLIGQVIKVSERKYENHSSRKP